LFAPYLRALELRSCRIECDKFRSQKASCSDSPDPHGIVVVRLRIGKIDERTTAHVLGILGQGERFEPIRNLLHGGHQRFRRGMTEFSTTAGQSLHQYIPDGTPRIRGFSLSFPVDFKDSSGIPIAIQQGRESKLILSAGVGGRTNRTSDSGPLGIKIGIAVTPVEPPNLVLAARRKIRCR